MLLLLSQFEDLTCTNLGETKGKSKKRKENETHYDTKNAFASSVDGIFGFLCVA